MAISKIILNGVTQMDVTGVTVEASNLLAPNTAVGADGQPVTGTMTEKVLTTKTITANGTYDAEDDNADGYSSVTVNVPSSGGSSSWTKIAETSYQISATNTTATTFATWSTGHSELWTSDKWVWVRIRDTAGKRSGYFYGSDNFYANINPQNDSSTASLTVTGRVSFRYNNGLYAMTTSTYGVYTGALFNDGRIEIMTRYNSTNSRTINGTYKVEVYLLDPPTNTPIFT